MSFLVIDNYDSFTYNLVHYLGELGAKLDVWRNDKITVEQVVAMDPQAIVLSPGPCTPNEAGTHDGHGIFRGIAPAFQATRYHSLTVAPDSIGGDLVVTATTGEVIMGLMHRTHPAHGVQFHPESIASEHGHAILKNFLESAAAWNREHRPARSVA